MSASLLSPFECLLLHEKQPIPVNINLYHRNSTPAFPATRLLSFLALPSKLSLRRVSPTTKAWIDSANPSVFSNLTILFPLNIFSAEQISALHTTSPQCTHLTITISEEFQLRKPTDATPLPPFPNLQHLSLTAPTNRPFQSLLSFRLALQSAHLPLLTHLALTNLSFPGILALRWGTFTSFGDANSTAANVWQGLKSLDVKIIGWWDENSENQQEQLGYHNHYYHENKNNNPHTSEPPSHLPTTNNNTPNPHLQKEHWRTYTRILHSWLHTFASHAHLQSFKFEYLNTEGPNPFLLDAFVPTDGKKEWFSAPGIRWKGLTDVWIGNVVLEERGFRALKERMEGLERVGVLVDCLDVGLGGVGVREGGRVWVQLGVGGEGEGVDGGVDGDGDVEGEKTGGGGKVAVRGSWRAGGGQEGDRASMVLPFMLDLETEEGGGL